MSTNSDTTYAKTKSLPLKLDIKHSVGTLAISFFPILLAIKPFSLGDISQF